MTRSIMQSFKAIRQLWGTYQKLNHCSLEISNVPCGCVQLQRPLDARYDITDSRMSHDWSRNDKNASANERRGWREHYEWTTEAKCFWQTRWVHGKWNPTGEANTHELSGARKIRKLGSAGLESRQCLRHVTSYFNKASKNVHIKFTPRAISHCFSVPLIFNRHLQKYLQFLWIWNSLGRCLCLLVSVQRQSNLENICERFP